MNQEIDCRGLQCPEPVMRCRALLNTVQPESLQVLVDNKAALENVRRFLEKQGYGTSEQQLSEREWRINASKSGELPAKEPDMEPDSGPGKTLLLLTTEGIGRGDDELGAKLMDTFLGNISELGPSLWRIILLNGAVKLSAREGTALEHLKAIERSGVDILVCGTCLNHYGLLEKKMVGQTTNMMDVLSSLALAQKVIRP